MHNGWYCGGDLRFCSVQWYRITRYWYILAEHVIQASEVAPLNNSSNICLSRCQPRSHLLSRSERQQRQDLNPWSIPDSDIYNEVASFIMSS